MQVYILNIFIVCMFRILEYEDCKFLKLSAVDLVSYGKTTMAHELLRIQMSHGFRDLIMTNFFQMSITRKISLMIILMANQLGGRKNILYIINEVKNDIDLESFYIFMYILLGYSKYLLWGNYLI